MIRTVFNMFDIDKEIERELKKHNIPKENGKTCLLEGCNKKCYGNNCFCSAEHHKKYHSLSTDSNTQTGRDK